MLSSNEAIRHEEQFRITDINIHTSRRGHFSCNTNTPQRRHRQVSKRGLLEK